MLYIVAIVTFLCHENNYVLTTTYLIWPFWMFGYWKAFQRPLSEVGSVWSTDTNCGQVWSLFSFVWRGFCMYYARPTYDIWTLHPISESSQEPDCIKNLWAFWAGLYLRYVRLVRIKTIIVVIKKELSKMSTNARGAVKSISYWTISCVQLNANLTNVNGRVA